MDFHKTPTTIRNFDEIEEGEFIPDVVENVSEKAVIPYQSVEFIPILNKAISKSVVGNYCSEVGLVTYTDLDDTHQDDDILAPSGAELYYVDPHFDHASKGISIHFYLGSSA